MKYIEFLFVNFSALLLLSFTSVHAAPYADIVIDVKTSKVLHAENPDFRQHPAGLTKLMTLYVGFSALATGEVNLDEHVKISLKAASEPVVKLGLRKDQEIKLRYLLRAIGIQGANDASTALAEHVAASEKSFSQRMQIYSDELGLRKSTWRNPHGLTQSQHLSTARDIATLFISLERDFPEYFNLFSRRSDDAGMRQVANSSRRVLNAINGATGAKYGYTRAAGFNNVVMVERGDKKIVVVVLGARSKASLVAHTKLLVERVFAKMSSPKK